MLMLCPIHGPQPAVMISRDLWVNGDHKPESGEIVDLIYIHEDVIAWGFYVSRDFARDHRLKAGIAPLPDQPGEWAQDLCCCCSKCFQKVHGGQFDERSRWHSDAK